MAVKSKRKKGTAKQAVAGKKQNTKTKAKGRRNKPVNTLTTDQRGGQRRVTQAA